MHYIRSLLYGLLAILALLALAPTPAAFASPTAEAFEAFIKTRLGSFILFETQEGRRLTTWLTGEIAPSAASVERVLARLKDPSLRGASAAEIETRVLRIREQYHGIKNAPELDLAPIPLNQARLLSRWASEELAFIESAEGLRFVAPLPKIGYAESVQAFLKATPSEVLLELKSTRQIELSPRLATFSAQWPHHIKLVPQVKFRHPLRDGAKTLKHDVLVISTHGLSAVERDALAIGVSRALFWKTVSFPMKPYAEHLYIRLGQKTYDFTKDLIRVAPYAASTNKRLEPVLQLTDREYQRLRQYMNAASADSHGVLGEFDPKGTLTPETEGLLTQNWPTTPGQYHNCVSWLCLAPIGERAEPLIELAGAKAGTKTQVDPGRWGEYLVAGAPTDRIFAVVYWTDEPLLSALMDIKTGVPFPKWGFFKTAP